MEIKLGELLKRATQVMMTMMMMMMTMMLFFVMMMMMMMMTAIMLLLVSLMLPRLMPMLNSAVQAAITSLWATFQQLKFGSSKVVPKDGTPYTAPNFTSPATGLTFFSQARFTKSPACTTPAPFPPQTF